MKWFTARHFFSICQTAKGCSEAGPPYFTAGRGRSTEGLDWVSTVTAVFSTSVGDPRATECQKLEQASLCHVRRSETIAQREYIITREWLTKLWREERTMRNLRNGRPKGNIRCSPRPDVLYHVRPIQVPDSAAHLADVDKLNNTEKPFAEQPPLSKPARRLLNSATAEEVKIAPLLARDNLLITRAIEWTNLMFGFEQENRYAIVDPCYPQSPVGFIRERSNVVFRQLLRTRRPFVAHVTDALGNELFRVHRPVWFINSTIYTVVNGKEVGVVHRRWHLWKRVYDLYLGNSQFAVVENPGFWNWTFTLKDIAGNVLAEIDRDWRGVGFELFTDAGQYAVRFGNMDTKSKRGGVGKIEELKVERPLTLAERALALALAVSLDNDYFSRHGGWGLPFIMLNE